MSNTLDFHNFSWKGDPRWAKAGWTIYAPAVVFVLFWLSIAEVALGSTWLVQMNHITVPKIIQTLLIPGLSFFNTLPSLHAHLLLRQNPPKMAMWFGTIFVIMMLVSPILMLGSCIHSPSAGPALRQAECYAGTPGPGGDSGVALPVWAILIACELLSAVGYGCHVVMAYRVHSVDGQRRRDGIIEAVDPAAEEARKQKARDLWIQMSNMNTL